MNVGPWLTVILALTGFVTAARADPVRDTAPATDCRALFNGLDTAVDAAGVRDQGPYAIPEFPYLRLDRFLASFRLDVTDRASFTRWVGALAELDRTARRFEFENLPASIRATFGNGFVQRVDRCRESLIAADLKDPEDRRRLLREARVPDEYEGSWRLLGLYPITALFVEMGVDRWHESAREQLKTTEFDSTGDVQWWRSAPGSVDDDPLSQADIAHILEESKDELGVPRPDAPDLERLFAHFAPDWGVEVAGSDDRIGQPAWRGDRIAIDTRNPVEYRRVSFTRFAGRTLLQLNYIIWFPARSGNDIYAGSIDGLNWRVTLGNDGLPLISDAIHNCGCYEAFYPSAKLRLRGGLSTAYIEPPLVFPPVSETGRARVRLASGTHLIRRVWWDKGDAAARALAVADYDELRSLPRGEGRKSMFGPYGIVAGSERPERYLLWPMGVRSPGAMRQWGRHAIAFVGRRHFDDPDLMDGLFVSRD
ncbi:MAG: hypothetical protein GC138_00220 [Gammaproteobacteria bacterium]|nr:hypothetical protein [Gammaproteobacteria bacterium]